MATVGNHGLPRPRKAFPMGNYYDQLAAFTADLFPNGRPTSNDDDGLADALEALDRTLAELAALIAEFRRIRRNHDHFRPGI